MLGLEHQRAAGDDLLLGKLEGLDRLVELYVAPEPVLAPFLLQQKIPVLVGVSNFLVATCNFTVMYNFPTWFQTVMLTSASEAGACCALPWLYARLSGAGKARI